MRDERTERNGILYSMFWMFMFGAMTHSCANRKAIENYTEIRERLSHYEERVIDTSKIPEIRDVNEDGIDDLVLRNGAGKEIILYGAGEIYSFENRRKRE